MLKVKCTILPTGSKGHRQVMPPISLAAIIAAGGLQLQLIDQNGAPFVIADPTTVTTTMTGDNPAATFAPGADALHYTPTVPQPLASSGGILTISATLTFVSGTPAGPFTASAPVNMDVAPPALVPTDLQIILGS